MNWYDCRILYGEYRNRKDINRLVRIPENYDHKGKHKFTFTPPVLLNSVNANVKMLFRAM